MTSDLASSLWHTSCQEHVTAPVLSGAVTADLAIIGGGYTGTSAALHAAELGADVRLIEAESFGAGGSGRNVGLANAGLWLPPEDINKELGAVTGNRLSAILGEGPKTVFDLISRYQINCEPSPNGTLHCAHAPAGMKDLRRRYDQLRAIGAPVELLNRADARTRVGTDAIHGALFDPRAGTIQPLAYARGLARAAQQAGAHLHAQTPATSLRHENGCWTVTTPKGQIRAKHLIMATNGYALPIKGYETPAMVPVHYFQAATPPVPQDLRQKILPAQEGCWDTALIMSSWRLDKAGRMVIGAMGALNHIGAGTHMNWLRRKLATLFPELADMPFEHSWFGRIAMTTEHLPKVLQLNNGYACFGYSGRGIAPGTLFGRGMAQALLRGDQSALPIPAVTEHSLSFAKIKQVYYETGATLTHLVKDRM